MTCYCCCIAITNEKLHHSERHVSFEYLQEDWIRIGIWYERHMKHHDIDCTQFRLFCEMGTRNYNVRVVIPAVRWKEETLVTTGCIWKRKPILKSRYETHVFSWSCIYHEGVQKAANFSQHPPLYSCIYEGLNVGIVLRHPKLCAEKFHNYWLLSILIFCLPYIKEHCFILLNLIFYAWI